MSVDLPDLARSIAEPGGELLEATGDSTHADRATSQSDSEMRFGVLTLRVVDGAGYLALPKDISLSVLKDLHGALLAGLERCSGVTIDMSAVTRCDLFFHQLLLAAKRRYFFFSKRLTATGALSDDLRAASQTQGFEVDASGCVLPLAPPG
ncbi:MAG: STAS domain-containing protein [Desulfovibrio sp.]|jgi:hypothetical protein